MSNALSREALLEALVAKPVERLIKDLGTVLIQQLTGEARVNFLTSHQALSESKKPLDQFELVVNMLHQVLVHPDGSPLLQAEDIPKLRQSNSQLIDALVEAAMDVNGMTKKSVETIEGN